MPPAGQLEGSGSSSLPIGCVDRRTRPARLWMPSATAIPDNHSIHNIATMNAPENNNPRPSFRDDVRHLHAGTTGTLHIILRLVVCGSSIQKGLSFLVARTWRKDKRGSQLVKGMWLGSDRAGGSSSPPVNFATFGSPRGRDREHRTAHPVEPPVVHQELPRGIAGNLHRLWSALTEGHVRSA